jgi:hypothetical protein
VTAVSRATAAGRAYLDLKAEAKSQSRLTDELIQLYVLEGFLVRVIASAHPERLVLKGGVLLAALGTRRPTRDIDFAARLTDNDVESVLALVREIAALTPESDDGLVFDPAGAAAEVIRDEDVYSGVRVSLGVELATARTRFHIDFSVGDPIWPAPRCVEVPRLMGGEPLKLVGYPLPMVYAEKMVTAVQRGTVNTRWRDFGDVWTLSGKHPVDADELQTAIAEVASHRRVELSPLRTVLEGYSAFAQPKYAAWRRKQRLDHLPEDFGDLLADYITFANPVIPGADTKFTWEPAVRAWQ